MDRFTLRKLLATFVQVRPRLEAVARARTGSRALAEDLIQDTWFKLEAARIEGPIDNPKDLAGAYQRALAKVRAGEPALIDVVSQPR